MGFIDSFFEVVRVCGDADYYAFCDQDDKWMPEKIQYGVEMLDMEDQKSPLLYFSNYDFYNEKKNNNICYYSCYYIFSLFIFIFD